MLFGLYTESVWWRMSQWFVNDVWNQMFPSLWDTMHQYKGHFHISSQKSKMLKKTVRTFYFNKYVGVKKLHHCVNKLLKVKTEIKIKPRMPRAKRGTCTSTEERLSNMREELLSDCGMVIWNALEEEVSRLVLQWPLTSEHSGSMTSEEWEVSTRLEFWLTHSLQGFIYSDINFCNDNN